LQSVTLTCQTGNQRQGGASDDRMQADGGLRQAQAALAEPKGGGPAAAPAHRCGGLPLKLRMAPRQSSSAQPGTPGQSARRDQMQPTHANARKATGSLKKARVMVVDDHPVFREGIARCLALEEDLEVCWSVGTARQALRCIAESHPDAAIVDLSLRGSSGMQLIRDIRARHPDLPILVVTMHDEAIYAERALRAGARGYVMKTEQGSVVVAALRQVLSGGVFLSDDMAARLLNTLVEGAGVPDASPIERLTDRELEVFDLIGRGLGTRRIAELLHLSPKTIESHRAHIKEKLGLRSASELTVCAVHWTLDEALS